MNQVRLSKWLYLITSSTQFRITAVVAHVYIDYSVAATDSKLAPLTLHVVAVLKLWKLWLVVGCTCNSRATPPTLKLWVVGCTCSCWAIKSRVIIYVIKIFQLHLMLLCNDWSIPKVYSHIHDDILDVFSVLCCKSVFCLHFFVSFFHCFFCLFSFCIFFGLLYLLVCYHFTSTGATDTRARIK